MRGWTLGFLAACALAMPAGAQAPKDALVVDLPGDVATMDPHLQWDTESYTVYRNIFDNLVTRDTAGKIVPQVATAWHYSDPTTVVFDLRSDITFQDGSKLTPEDVAFSIRRITNPDFKSPQLSQFDQIVSADVTGPAQVTIRTRSPYPVLMAQLVKLSIVPKAYVEKLGDQKFNQEPMGSGPYRLRSWQRGVGSQLEATDGYWRGKPPFRGVTFRAVPDISTRIADLRTGRADITRGISPDDAVNLKSERNLKILSVATERVAYLFVNTLAGPTKDKRIRQAIAMGIDRDTLINALQQGFAKPTNVVLTPANFGYVPDIKGWPYDPVRARALVKEAGAEGTVIPLLTSPSYDRRLNEAVQQMLGDIGLKVEITMVDQPTFLKRRQGMPEEALALSQGRWSCACQDADGVIFPLFRSGSIWSKFNNKDFDAAVDAARTTLDEGQRLAHYRRAFEILREEVPGIGLFQDAAIYLAKKELQWQPTANEAFFIMDMKWQP
jgi:peptide/nickel transport system substrate-binding protein